MPGSVVAVKEDKQRAVKKKKKKTYAKYYSVLINMDSYYSVHMS